MLNTIYSLISDNLRDGSYKIPEFTVEHPKNSDFGDISSNIAMKLAGVLKKNPMLIAEDIRGKLLNLNKPFIDRIDVVRPGFINFFILDDY